MTKGNNLSCDSLPTVLYILWCDLIYNLALRYPQRKKSIGVRSGDRACHYVARPRPTIRRGNRVCKRSRTIIRRWAGASYWIHQALRTPPSALHPIWCRASNTRLLHYMGPPNPKKCNRKLYRRVSQKRLQSPHKHVKIHPVVHFMGELGVAYTLFLDIL